VDGSLTSSGQACAAARRRQPGGVPPLGTVTQGPPWPYLERYVGRRNLDQDPPASTSLILISGRRPARRDPHRNRYDQPTSDHLIKPAPCAPEQEKSRFLQLLDRHVRRGAHQPSESTVPPARPPKDHVPSRLLTSAPAEMAHHQREKPPVPRWRSHQEGEGDQPKQSQPGLPSAWLEMCSATLHKQNAVLRRPGR